MAAPSGAPEEAFDLGTYTWTDEDIRFVTADLDAMVENPRAEIDPIVRLTAEGLMDAARVKTEQLQVELGHPAGFDPLVQCLLYARARCDAATEHAAVNRALDLCQKQLDTCRGALEQAADLIQMYREATG